MIADSIVIGALNNGIVAGEDFVIVGNPCSIARHARRKFIDAYERRMDDEVTHPVFGYRISYRRLLEVQARLLGRVVLGELQRYPAFITR